MDVGYATMTTKPRPTRKLRSTKPGGRISELSETRLSKFDFSLSTLKEVASILGARNTTSDPLFYEKNNHELGIRRREANRRKKNQEAMHSSIKSGEFYGDYRKRLAVLDLALECMAVCPDDGFNVLAMKELLRFKTTTFSVKTKLRIAYENGWFEVIDRPKKPYRMAPYTPVRPSDHQVYRITEEGRAVRSWSQWLRERVARGERCPMLGKKCAYVKYWVRGLHLPHVKGGQLWGGYKTGDAEDAPWPDLRYWEERLSEHNSRKAVTTPDFGVI